ncbi:MAG TPA: sugar phosphate nucleotidyltransferase [Polyangiaceae bacterium]
MLPAMVLAAGLGTRLRPLTDLRAKPLVPVGDRPALAHVLEALRAAGVPRAVVNAHHHAAQLEEFARDQRDLSVSVERDLLGTAGGLAQAASLLGPGDVIVWNGDILADVDLPRLVAAHRAAATLLVQPMAPGQGSVGLDGEGKVVRLRMERFEEEAQGGQFLGIHVLGARLRDRLPAAGGLVEDVFVPAMARGETLRAVPFHGAWHDIGTVTSYLEANAAWLARHGLQSWKGPGARVAEGVSLDGSIVGEGARVEGRGVVVRSVVWPGASAVAPLEGRVVTS